MQILPRITDDFYKQVENFEGFTLYHTKEWHTLIHAAFGWNVSALVERNKDDQIVWYLPYVAKRSLNLKIKNIALPLSHRVLPAVNPAFSNPTYLPESFSPFDNLEIHGFLPVAGMLHPQIFDLTTLPLSRYKDQEEYLAELDYKSVRYMMNRARRDGIAMDNAFSAENFEAFYHLELETRIRLGSLMYPRNFFHLIWENFKSQDWITIHVAKKNGVPLAGAIFFHFGDTTTYVYTASLSDKETRKSGANELVVWEGISQAFNRGMKQIDFGTSLVSQAGLKFFKEKWKGVHDPFPYTVITRNAESYRRIDREGLAARMLALMIRHSPRSLVQIFSPYLLKLAI